MRGCLSAGCLPHFVRPAGILRLTISAAAPLGCAYHRAEHEEHLIKLNAQEFLMRKATRGHPLSEAEQQTNYTISRMRVRVEHIFTRRAKMGADLCRSIGLKRATQAQPPEQLGL